MDEAADQDAKPSGRDAGAFDDVVALACRMTGAPMAVLVDDTHETPALLAASGFADRSPVYPLDACRDALRDGRPRRLDDGADAAAIVPLAPAAGQAQTVICVMDASPRDWSEADLDLLGRLASRVVARRLPTAEPAPRGELDHLLLTPLRSILDMARAVTGDTHPARAAARAAEIHAVAHAAIEAGERWMSPHGAAPRSEVAPLVRPARPEPLPPRVLLADDLDLNRKLIADMLSIDGYVVECVADGAAAVRAASQTAFDLVLMDMVMPGMDGVAAARAIRALPGPAGKVPIIALTANSFAEQHEQCRQAGMDALLTKPMSFESLTAMVRSWTLGRTEAA